MPPPRRNQHRSPKSVSESIPSEIADELEFNASQRNSTSKKVRSRDYAYEDEKLIAHLIAEKFDSQLRVFASEDHLMS